MITPTDTDRLSVLAGYRRARTRRQLTPLAAMKTVWRAQADMCLAYLAEGRQPPAKYVGRWIAASEYMAAITGKQSAYWFTGRKAA